MQAPAFTSSTEKVQNWPSFLFKLLWVETSFLFLHLASKMNKMSMKTSLLVENLLILFNPVVFSNYVKNGWHVDEWGWSWVQDTDYTRWIVMMKRAWERGWKSSTTISFIDFEAFSAETAYDDKKKFSHELLLGWWHIHTWSAKREA